MPEFTATVRNDPPGSPKVPMTCPHCLHKVVIVLCGNSHYARHGDTSSTYTIRHGHCPSPECNRLVVLISEGSDGVSDDGAANGRLVVPVVRSVAGFADVPEDILSDYAEAAQVLDISPNASAALARRCLQATIRNALGKKDSKDKLSKEIAEFQSTSTTPPYLKDSLKDIRILGNVAAHPDLDAHTSMIVKVSPDDARWLLRILEELFKHCFVAPAEFERRTRGAGEGPGGQGSQAAGHGGGVGQ